MSAVHRRLADSPPSRGGGIDGAGTDPDGSGTRIRSRGGTDARLEAWPGDVPERIELDPELEACRVSSDLMHEICRHALDVKPEECCGLILGNLDVAERWLAYADSVVALLPKEPAEAIAYKNAERLFNVDVSEQLFKTR